MKTTLDQKEKQKGTLNHPEETEGKEGRSLSPPPFQLKSSTLPKMGHQPIQMFEDEGASRKKANRFMQWSDEERNIVTLANKFLTKFSKIPTQQMHGEMLEEIERFRQEMKYCHAKMVEIFDEYELADPQMQGYFWDELQQINPQATGILPSSPEEQEPMGAMDKMGVFNRIMEQTKLAGNDQSLAPYRSRFLTFAMQGMQDNLGVAQYGLLDQLLGEREIKIDLNSRSNLSGGMEVFEHSEFARKTNPHDQNQLNDEFEMTGGTGMAYLHSKDLEQDMRMPNPNRDQIGNMQVNMDTGNELMPIFAGDKKGNPELFTCPKKMAVHHEVGHMISMLQGKSGQGHKPPNQMTSMSDQEEMYNIWEGPRSDRVYCEEMGLPTRFDHGSLNPYFGQYGNDEYDDFAEPLKKGHRFLNNPAELREKIETEVKRLVYSSWGSKVQNGFTPSGVSKMRPFFGNFSIEDAIKIAKEVRTQISNDRDPFTQKFYNLVAALDFNNTTQMIEDLITLKGMQL